DVSVTTRYGVLNYREQPFGLDVGLGLQVPTGDRRRDLGEGRVSLEPSFTASAWLGHVNAQANGSWRHTFGRDGETEDEGEYNVALVYPIGGWFLVLEGNGESSREGTKYYLTPEVVWKGKRLELRLAVPAPVTDPAGDYAVVVGCTVEFEHLFHRTEDD